MKINLFIIFLLIITTTSCSMIPTQTKPVEVVTIPKPIPLYHPPLPIELQLVDVDWSVITPEIMKIYLAELENGDAPATAYYSLTSKEYENLSMNMAELKRYIQDSLHIIEFYRDYDEEVQDDE
jgi:hypothetical protein